jgi:DNA-binding transcriptional regulator YdaS (Cro superfamily)
MKAITQKKQAELLGLNPSHFNRIISCQLNARGALAREIANFTKTNLALWLVGGTGTPELRRAAVQAWAASA